MAAIASSSIFDVTIEARYDLCLCVITLLFFFADELETWDAYLLAEIFAVFKGVAMLRFVGAQPADGGRSGAQGEASVVGRRHDCAYAEPECLWIQVSNYLQVVADSLLITQSSVADDIVTTAHNFLDGTGVLRSLSPTHTTQHEIAFTNRIRLLNFVNVAWELLSWLPRTPAAVFLQSLVLRQLGRIDDAAHLLETLAGCIGKP
jgi:nuclear pore complex protein Nup160